MYVRARPWNAYPIVNNSQRSYKYENPDKKTGVGHKNPFCCKEDIN